MEDESLSSPVDECKAFELASLNEENELWRDAYDAYQVYSGTYPNGPFAAEVHEHSAIALSGDFEESERIFNDFKA